VLSRLAQAGLTPTRLVPAGAAWSVLRFVHDEAPEAALEIDAKGWSLSTYDGLAWTGVRTGFGAAPAELRDRARREGWAVCDWRVSPGVVGESATWRPDDLHAEHAALGAALLDLARVDARGVAAPSEIDLLGTPARRSLRVGALGWFATACAMVVVGLLVWSDAARARAEREVAALTAEVAEVRPAVERVEALRAQAEAIVKAHDRLSGLERTYRPMSLTLSELATALPRDSHLARVEFADTGVTADVVTSSRTQLMRAIESSPMFQGVALTTGSVSRATGEEQFGLGFNFEAPAPGAEEGR
jgi:Tfp pilus assembly protein PilN